MTAPLLAGGVIYVPGCDTYSNTSLMLAIRASDGARLWEVSPGPGDGWLAYDGTTVCAVSGVSPDAQPPPDAGPEPTQMWTWRASDGQLLYRSPVSAGYCSQPAMTAGMAFALTAGNGHTLSRAARRKSRYRADSMELPGSISRARSSPRQSLHCQPGR